MVGPLLAPYACSSRASHPPEGAVSSSRCAATRRRTPSGPRARRGHPRGGARRPPLPEQGLPHGAAAAPAANRGLHHGRLSQDQACAHRDGHTRVGSWSSRSRDGRATRRAACARGADSGADAGHRRHPWPCAWLLETGWRVRPRRRDRAPWAGGGPDVGRGGRPETDANHRIIGRSAAVQRAPPAAGRRRQPPDPPIRADPLERAPPIAAAAMSTHAASLSRPPERGWTDGRPSAAVTQVVAAR